MSVRSGTIVQNKYGFQVFINLVKILKNYITRSEKYERQKFKQVGLITIELQNNKNYNLNELKRATDAIYKSGWSVPWCMS